MSVTWEWPVPRKVEEPRWQMQSALKGMSVWMSVSRPSWMPYSV